MFVLLVESPLWLFRNDMNEQGLESLRHIARVNGVVKDKDEALEIFPSHTIISTADIDEEDDRDDEDVSDEESSESAALWKQIKELFGSKYRWNMFMLVLSKSYTYFMWFMNLYQIQKL